MKRLNTVTNIVCTKTLIAVLLFASFLMTTSTLAYFADDTTGSTTTSVASFQIGEYSRGNIHYSIINALSTSGYIVDIDTVLNGSSNSDILTFDLNWDPSEISANNDDVEMNITYTLDVIYNNKVADQATIDRMMSILTITATPINPSNIDVSTGTASYTYTFSVPSNLHRKDEVFMSKIDVTILFDFTIQTIPS